MKPKKKTPQERWRERNPVKYWAHSATRSAVKRGLIEKAPCQRCGNPDSEAHHVDYYRPLQVEWLCRPCHKAAHKAFRKAAE